MKVSYSDLEDAFLFANYETRHYWLDKQTGRVLSYSSEAAEALQEGDLSDLPDWMADDVAAAREVLGQWLVASGQGSVADPLDTSPSSTEENDPNIEIDYSVERA